MNRVLLKFASLALLISLLAACAPAATPVPTAQPLVFTDGLNRKVTLPGPAQKVVSLAPSNTEILFAIGAGGQMVGRDEFSDTPVEAKNLPSVGGSMGNYNLEAITGMKPDLVLAAEINTPEQVKAIEGLGIPVFYLANPVRVEDIPANVVTVGQLVGREKEAAALATDLHQRIQAVKTSLANVAEQPVVFYELDGSDPAKPWTTGPGTYMDQMLAIAGGKNAAAGLSTQWGQISQEELLVQNPDIILLGDAAYGTTLEQVAQRPGWSEMNAVKNGRIVTFDDNLVSRPGPRLVNGLEMIAAILHPAQPK